MHVENAIVMTEQESFICWQALCTYLAAVKQNRRGNREARKSYKARVEAVLHKVCALNHAQWDAIRVAHWEAARKVVG